MTKGTELAGFSRRTILCAAASLPALARRAGSAQPQLPRVASDLPYAPSLAELSKGAFSGTAVSEESGGIVLEKGPGGTYRSTGSYVSPVVSVPNDGSASLSWRERWTTPTSWAKHESNPILGPAPPGNWDAGSITTCSVVKLRDSCRMYYGSRPNGIGLATASPGNLHAWIRNAAPVLSAGLPHGFDASGANSPEVIPVSGSHWHMYYVGYHPRDKSKGMAVHQIGLAESDDGGLTWRHHSDRPVIPHGEPGACDAFSTSSASVLRVGGRWLLWYGGIAQVPYLVSICLATSEDGHIWRKYEGNPVLSFNPHIAGEAFSVAKPHVLHEDGLFKMWYSAVGFGSGCRPGQYRVCYAESRDGVHWERFPKNPVLQPSPSGWDHEMVEYAEVLHDDEAYHMWFCGDRFGSIGYARGRPQARVMVQARGGAAPQPDAGWRDWSPPLRSPSGSRIGLPGDRYLQIRLSLETEDSDWSPAVEDLRVSVERGK